MTNPFSDGYSGPAPEVKVDAPVEPEKAWAEREPLITDPGFYPNITPAMYFDEPCAEPALTNSGIKYLAPEGAAPAKFAYHHPAIGQLPEERNKTKALYMGSLVHRLALDKGDDYKVSPYADFRSLEAREWKKDVESRGIIPVKQADFDEAMKMANVIRTEITKATQGYTYQTEVVAAWKEAVTLDDGEVVEIWCRCMFDVLCPELNVAFDVKTAIDCTDDALQKWFSKAYAQQATWYLRGLQKITGNAKDSRFGFLFVEKEPPYLARPAHSNAAFYQGAWITIEAAMKTFATCLRDGIWGGYEPFEAIPTAWQVGQWSDLEDGEISVGGE